jgi:hypothetical protein
MTIDRYPGTANVASLTISAESKYSSPECLKTSAEIRLILSDRFGGRDGRESLRTAGCGQRWVQLQAPALPSRIGGQPGRLTDFHSA